MENEPPNPQEEPDSFPVRCAPTGEGLLRVETEGGKPADLSPAEARELARDLIELSLTLEYSFNEIDREDWMRIPMQYLHIYAEQDPEFDHDEMFAGADIECWIKDQTRKNALIIAQAWIEEAGWRVVELEEQGEILREDHADDDVEFFDQAVFDEQVFVFNVIPRDDDLDF